MKDGFDWVEARAAMNLNVLFDRLREVVYANVRSACVRVAPDIVVDEPVPGRFLVTVPFPGRTDVRGSTRTFELCGEDSSIRVFGAGVAPLLVARLHLGDADCPFEVDRSGGPGACPMGLADLSRAALEPVFFRGC